MFTIPLPPPLDLTNTFQKVALCHCRNVSAAERTLLHLTPYFMDPRVYICCSSVLCTSKQERKLLFLVHAFVLSVLVKQCLHVSRPLFSSSCNYGWCVTVSLIVSCVYKKCLNRGTELRLFPLESYALPVDGHPSVRPVRSKHHHGDHGGEITFRKRETKDSSWTDEMPATLGP